MPKFSREYLRQATNPGMFGLGVMGLGQQLGTALQGRRARDAQMQMMTLGNQALSASEQGDMQALNMRRQQLMDLLSKTTNEGARNNIINAINQINQMRPATQTRATTNTANAIIKTEKALEDMRNSTEPMTNEEYMQNARLQSVLEERLAVMKQNSKAVLEADSIEYKALYNEIEKKNKLAEQQAIANRRTLSSVSFESEQYKQLAKKLRDSGFGDTVDKYEKDQYELIEAREAANKIREDRSPLTSAEKETLTAYGFDPKRLELSQAKDILAKITEREVEDRIRMTNAPNARIANQAILSHVEATLRTLQKQGDLPFNLFDDLYNKIEDMSQEDIQRLADQLRRPTGQELTETEIQQKVIDFLKTEFPSQFRDATRKMDSDLRLNDELQVMTADLLAEAGLVKRNEDGTVTINIITKEQKEAGFEGVTEMEYRLAQREIENRRGIVSSLVKAYTGEKTRPEEREPEIYSPAF